MELQLETQAQGQVKNSKQPLLNGKERFRIRIRHRFQVLSNQKLRLLAIRNEVFFPFLAFFWFPLSTTSSLSL